MDEFSSNDTLNISTKNFIKSTFFIFFLSGICALRAANKYTMFLIYQITLLRTIQLAGVYCKIKLVS